MDTSIGISEEFNKNIPKNPIYRLGYESTYGHPG